MSLILYLNLGGEFKIFLSWKRHHWSMESFMLYLFSRAWCEVDKEEWLYFPFFLFPFFLYIYIFLTISTLQISWFLLSSLLFLWWSASIPQMEKPLNLESHIVRDIRRDQQFKIWLAEQWTTLESQLSRESYSDATNSSPSQWSTSKCS